jgi:serine/threonine-protein kinase
MRHDRWRQIDELFDAALEREGAEARADFLREACAGDDSLRREVEKMLGFDRQAEDFIETPVFGVAARLMTGQPGGALLVEQKDSVKRPPTHSTSGSIDEARFVPGDVLAERYRIAGLLGRGGMGEVYRADDLKLKQPVALKFLPETLSTDGASALARFYQEVSVARQISHRHVCRVYDVGEYEGQHFISMEFVRGEELASLLKRIKRLPHDKAVEVARQLCGGLAAIHDRGVLHRDLKPANIMLDERGDVRITDFGIAALTESLHAAREVAGTPAYMSPEQLDGRELTVTSDIYSLGLVLYEIFTGKKAFEAANLNDMLRLRRSDTTPTSPSQLIADLDPLVERVILRCLETEPGARPASALQVAAALPGGDPLAAALAAGETPSPEMVAAAPKQGSLSPPVALALLAAVLVSVALVVFFSGRVAIHRFVPLKRSPDDLKERAREIAKRAGYAAPALDSAHGFAQEYEYLDYVRKQDSSPDRWEKLKTGQPAAITFWYRQSPQYLEAYDYGQITPHDPPNEVSGMLLLKLDTTGRLTYFEAAPPQVDETTDANAVTNTNAVTNENANANVKTSVNVNEKTSANVNANVNASVNANANAAPDWTPFFQEAGLDIANFRRAQSRWTPPRHADARAAWEGTYPGRAELPLKVEAAAYRGKPVYFELIGSWQRPNRQTPFAASGAQKIFATLLLTFYFGALTLAALLAWRNLRLGRGDRRGALRLTLFVFVLRMIYWVFYAHHVPTAGEVVGQFVGGLQSALYWSCFIGLMYLALEPFLRRRWPEWIISWSRLLAGDFRDPLIGRDVLVGAAFGLCVPLAQYAQLLLPRLFGAQPPSLATTSNLLPELGLLGLSGFIPLLINQATASLMFPFIIISVLLFFTMLFRRKRLGIAASWLLFYVALNLNFGEATPLSLLLGAILPTILLAALTRFGLLALIATHFYTHILPFYPVTTEFSAWYATSFLLQLFVLGTLLLYAFYTSLAGQPLFRGRFLED